MKYIVLAHGVLGFSTINVFGFDIADYFNDVKKALEEKNNYKVYTPEVSPVASIEDRAKSLRDQIYQFIAKNNIPPDKSIGIFAHSMGGLDARQALFLEQENLSKYVRCLVTIGTPHLGSPIAELLADKNPLTRLLYTNIMKILGDSVGALKNLTPTFCEKFDKDIENVEGVKYYSIAGVINQSANSSGFFSALGTKIDEPNDGVVAVSSAAKGGEGWSNLENWLVDHAGLVGWYEPTVIHNQLELEHVKRYLVLAEKVLPV